MPSFFTPSRLLGILPRPRPAAFAPVAPAAQVLADYAKTHGLPLRHEGPDLQAQATIATRGLFLARQERWSDLSHEMKMADRHLDRTLGGVAHAPLLARGAAGDAIGPLLQVLADPGLVAAHAPGGGIAALQEALENYDRSKGIWRGTGQVIPEERLADPDWREALAELDLPGRPTTLDPANYAPVAGKAQ